MTRVTLSQPIDETGIRVIERLQITVPKGSGVGSGFASKQPLAVVLPTECGIRVLDLEGMEIPLRRLRLMYPHLPDLSGG